MKRLTLAEENEAVRSKGKTLSPEWRELYRVLDSKVEHLMAHYNEDSAEEEESEVWKFAREHHMMIVGWYGDMGTEFEDTITGYSTITNYFPRLDIEWHSED